MFCKEGTDVDGHVPVDKHRCRRGHACIYAQMWIRKGAQHHQSWWSANQNHSGVPTHTHQNKVRKTGNARQWGHGRAHPPTNGHTKWCSHSATAQFLVTLNMHRSPDSASPFPGIYPKQMATHAHKQAWTRILTAASLTTAKNWKLHGRMDTQPWYIPATEFSSAIKRINKPMPYKMWAKRMT